MAPSTDLTDWNGDATDRAFRALSSGIRRQVLLALRESSPRQISELAELTGGAANNGSVMTVLHHHHLPYLDNAGYTDTNWDRDRVSRGEQFDEIIPLLRELDGDT